MEEGELQDQAQGQQARGQQAQGQQAQQPGRPICILLRNLQVAYDQKEDDK